MQLNLGRGSLGLQRGVQYLRMGASGAETHLRFLVFPSVTGTRLAWGFRWKQAQICLTSWQLLFFLLSSHLSNSPAFLEDHEQVLKVVTFSDTTNGNICTHRMCTCSLQFVAKGNFLGLHTWSFYIRLLGLGTSYKSSHFYYAPDLEDSVMNDRYGLFPHRV